MTSVDENPFAALLQEGTKSDDGVSHKLIEEVLLFTLNKARGADGTHLLCLADVVVDTSDESLGEDLVAHALFERLMLSETSQYSAGKASAEALESRAICYLYGAFARCERIQAERKVNCSTVIALILNNASTCMRQPDLFAPQSFASQWLELFEQADEHDTSTQEFLVRVACKVVEEDEPIEALGALKAIFYPLLTEMQKVIVKENLVTIKKNIFWILGFFVRDKRAAVLGELLIDYTTPNPKAKGQVYDLTWPQFMFSTPNLF